MLIGLCITEPALNTSQLQKYRPTIILGLGRA